MIWAEASEGSWDTLAQVPASGDRDGFVSLGAQVAVVLLEFRAQQTSPAPGVPLPGEEAACFQSEPILEDPRSQSPLLSLTGLPGTHTATELGPHL